MLKYPHPPTSLPAVLAGFVPIFAVSVFANTHTAAVGLPHPQFGVLAVGLWSVCKYKITEPGEKLMT